MIEGLGTRLPGNEQNFNVRVPERGSLGTRPTRSSVQVRIASFPGLPRLRFLISFCILQAIKNRSRGRPGNEARSVSVSNLLCPGNEATALHRQRCAGGGKKRQLVANKNLP